MIKTDEQLYLFRNLFPCTNHRNLRILDILDCGRNLWKKYDVDINSMMCDAFYDGKYRSVNIWCLLSCRSGFKIRFYFDKKCRSFDFEKRVAKGLGWSDAPAGG